MSEFDPVKKAGWRKRLSLINLIMKRLKALQNIKIEMIDADDSAKVIYSDESVTIYLPRSS